MKWSYGLTTIPQRIEDGLLERTLKSLADGGFPSPRIFVDGPLPSSKPLWFEPYECSQRIPRIRTFGNFILGLWEIYLREPNADRYAMFQDDFVTYKGLREYLESCKYPTKGYWNLYTFPQNEKKFEGWYLSNQLGKGAVALVFDRITVTTLLGSQQHIILRPQEPSDKSWKAIDGGIVSALKKADWQEWVHNPSLVQHTGHHSTMGNRVHEQAGTFLGEDFDVRRLIPKPAPVHTETSKRRRIGLVGYNCNTGLGELNRQIATYADVYSWLVKPHSLLPTKPPHPDTETMICPSGSPHKIEQFIKSVDVVVFCEQPYYNTLIDLCANHGRRTVCVPMMEWMPPGAKGWPQQVDLFICPTQQCYDVFAHVVPCVQFPWPVDVARYKFKHRSVCERFLFCNGNGGWKGRKGGEVIRQAKKLWPEMPLIIRSQKQEDWQGWSVLPEVAENYELYTEGDVLISPHSVDGLGLEGQEAMACGMPVISTKGKPWEEVPALARILAKSEKRTVRRPVDWYLPDPIHLVETCKSWLGKDISAQSKEARAWAESMDWSKFTDQFNFLVREGKAQANH